jgi:Domain of unknown function (DUF222)
VFEGDDVIAALQHWERVISYAQAQQLKAIMELAELRRRPDGEDEEYLADEIALALTISRVAASQRLGLAWELVRRLPATLGALERGEIDQVRARAISDAVAPLSDERAAAVEARVLGKATDQNAPQLRRSLKRAVIAVDPDGAQARHEQRREDRRIVLSPQLDGMSELYAYLPAPAASAIYLAVDQAARHAQAPGDARTADQRRADAFVDLILGDSSALPAQVKVVVPAATLLGADDQPGELAGYGPIPANLAREVAADATWRRLLTEPASGALLDYGRTAYKPPAALADFVRARDKTCRFPGCTRAAQRCELDHRIPYPVGPTSADNLDALCTHHHQLKHRSNWTGERLSNGDYQWTSPAGHTYTQRAEPILEPVVEPGLALVGNADPPPF